MGYSSIWLLCLLSPSSFTLFLSLSSLPIDLSNREIPIWVFKLDLNLEVAIAASLNSSWGQESFFGGTITILGLLIEAFNPLLQHAVLSPALHSFMLSAFSVTMMLCTIALIADVSLRRIVPRFGESHRSEILRTIALLTGSLAVISLLSISKPYIALVFFLVWLLLAIYLIHGLYQEPTTNNTTSNSEP